MRKHNGNARNIAMLLGGVAAGVVGGRFLPPMLASLAGSRRVRAGADPFALLISDHREILSLLDEMLVAPAHSNAKRARLFIALKRKLARHALAEEDVVYPIVRNDSAGGNQRIHLYDEHADMKIFLHEIEDQIQSGEDWTRSVSQLRELVRRHTEDEEKNVFPELRRQLADSVQPKVSGRIAREEALIV